MVNDPTPNHRTRKVSDKTRTVIDLGTENGINQTKNAIKNDQSKVDAPLLEQWSTLTGWHGIADAYMARSCYWRWMWILVVVFSMILGINQCVSMIMDFADEDRWTSSISSKLVSTLPVPTMLVCSLNIYNLSAVKEYGITIDQLLKNAWSNANVPDNILVKTPIQDDEEIPTVRPTSRKPNFGFPEQFPQQNMFPNDQHGQFGQNAFPGAPMGFGGQGSQQGIPNMQNVPGMNMGGQQQGMGIGAQPGGMGMGPQGMGGSQGMGGPQGVGGPQGMGGPQSVGGLQGMAGPQGMNPMGQQNLGLGAPQGGGPNLAAMGQQGMGIGGPNMAGVGAQQGVGMGGPGMGAMGQQSGGIPGGGGFPGGGQGGGQGGMAGFGKRFRREAKTSMTKVTAATKLASTASKKIVATSNPPRQKGPMVTTQKSVTIEPEQDEEDIFAGLENSTFECSATVIGCGAGSDLTWSNETVLATDKCCHVTTKKDEHYCFTVNLTYPFRNMLTDEGEIHIASSENTVFVLMNPRLDQYVGALVSGERPGQGFRLYFGVGYDAKYYSKPILVQPGTYSLIELTLEEVKTTVQRERGITNLVTPNPPCIINTNVTYKWVTQPQYEKWACEADCHIQREMAWCNCTTLEGDYRPDSIYCANVSTRTYCKKLITREKNKPDSAYYRCKRKCREACDWKSLSAVASTTTFPAPAKIERIRHFLKAGGHNFTVEEVKTLSLIEIYYGSMFIKLTERSERATLNELISNIGGALGAWTGISLLTIYQVFVYLMMGCIDTVFDQKKHSHNKRS